MGSKLFKFISYLNRFSWPFVDDRRNEELLSFETLVYPLGDPDAVTITTKDVEILRPMGFLNDTIIDFYVK